MEEPQIRFVEVMATFAKEVGIVGATEGRLLGHLILADEPLTQDDLMALTGSSRGNVSTALRNLLEGDFVCKIRVSGSRRDHYEARADLWRITIGFVIRRIGRQIKTAGGEFLRILDAARALKTSGKSAAVKRDAARLFNRVETLTTYTNGASKLLETVQKLVERGKD